MNKHFIFLIRIVVGGLFFVSGFTKLIEPTQNFLATILSYELFSYKISQGLAIAVPWIELILGAHLLTNVWSRISGVMLWLLNSIFIVFIAQALIRHLPITTCGCFGESFFDLPLRQALMMDITVWILLGLFYLSSYNGHGLAEQ